MMPKRGILAWAVAVGVLSNSGPALAQQVVLESTAAQKCLTLAPEAQGKASPTYPFVPFKQGTKGRVQVSLRFSAPDRRPSVEVLESEGGDEFVDAVKDHVRHLRVPCLQPGDPPADLRFDFVFKPDDQKVATGQPTDAQSKAREAMIACARRPDGKKPSYSMSAEREGRQGRVLVRLRFDGPDRAPVVQSFARRSAGALKQDAEDWARGLRMPCHVGGPIEYDIVFVYLMEGSHYGFRPDLSFAALVSLTSKEHRERLPATTDMGCPFNVSLLYRKPELSNRVQQIGTYHPARQPMLEWLAEAELHLPRGVSDSIFGDETRFAVPCLKL
jgi:hypothetical protein